MELSPEFIFSVVDKIQNGHDLTGIKKMIKENPIVVSHRDKFGRNLLCLISGNYVGYEPLIELLVYCGCGIDNPDNNMFTPIHSCCVFGNQTYGLFLINKGANVNILNFLGFSCIYTLTFYRKNEALFFAVLKAGAEIESDIFLIEKLKELKEPDCMYVKFLNGLRMKIVFASVLSVSRIVQKSKLGLLSKDIIRKLFSEFLFY
jgi:hypothetical protein